jgi:PPOX class probable F420-dependent enzyme
MTSRAERLATDMNVWFAAVRADGRPHLTPIWFVYVDDHMWLCTTAGAVKARLVRANPRVSVALEDGNAPVTGEGTAVVRPVGDAPDKVRNAFQAKYAWDIREDPDNVVIDITIAKWLSPGATIVS